MGVFVTGEIVRAVEKAGKHTLNQVSELGSTVGQFKETVSSPGVDGSGRHSSSIGNVTRAAAASSGALRSVLKICGRAGVAGAVVDGAVGGAKAVKFLQNNRITGGQALQHVGAEAGCGFVTSASGTAGTILVYYFTGSMGPLALAVGMGASVGSRYVFRQAVGETLPEDEGEASEPNEVTDFEDIGPDSEDGDI